MTRKAANPKKATGKRRHKYYSAIEMTSNQKYKIEQRQYKSQPHDQEQDSDKHEHNMEQENRREKE